jgi:hypothetical protein
MQFAPAVTIPEFGCYAILPDFDCHEQVVDTT